MIEPSTDRASRPRTRAGWPAQLVLVVLAAAGAVGASIATASSSLFQQNLFLLFLVAILASALAGGWVPGLVAAITSVVGASYYLFEPAGSFEVLEGPDRLRRWILLATSLLIVGLAELLRTTWRRVGERELALRESEESYRALFDNSADALYLLNSDGVFVKANRAAEELYGMDRGALVGRTPADLSDPAVHDPAFVRDRLQRAFAGEAMRFEWTGRRMDGRTMPLEIGLSRTRYFGQTVVLAAARDLTEQRQMEEQLRQSQKMEAVGRLAGGVSHDFNNLLTTIRGHAALVGDALGSDDPLRADVAEIERAADLATHVTRQLLAFSRSGEQGEPDAVPLDPAVESLERMLRRVIGVDVGIQLDLNAGPAAVRMDPGQLEQILLNLVVNARDAMPEGGTITIATEADPPTPTPAHAASGDRRRRVHLSVRDTGVGMDAETLERAFEPFFTTKARGEGTGLGLSTVYGIVQQSHGRVRIDSAPGRGTCFHLDFPRAAARGADDHGAAPSPQARQVQQGQRAPQARQADRKPTDRKLMEGAPATGTSRQRAILLVDDEEAVRSLMARVLTRAGHRVVPADSPEAAWRAFLADPEGFDLVVTDVAMPGERGPQLARRIRERAPSIPVLFASGSDGLDPSEALADDPGLFLQKPFTPTELERTVEEILETAAAPAG